MTDARTDTPAPVAPRVQEVEDHVEVTGMGAGEVSEALALLDAANELRRGARQSLLHQLTEVMLVRRIPLVGEATQRQLQRSAGLRDRLLQHGSETYASLAALTGKQESSVRGWATRERSSHRLFTVQVAGRTVIPSVQLDDRGSLQSEVTALVTPLLEAGADGWEVWSWLCSPTGWLSGEQPGDVALSNPDRAQGAARRYARQLGSDAYGRQ